MDKLTYEQALAELKRRHVELFVEDPLYGEKPSSYLRDAWIQAGAFECYIPEPNEFGDSNLELRLAALSGIWDCLLAEWLRCIPSDETIEDGAALLIDVMYSPEKWSDAQEKTLQGHTDLYTLLDGFVHLCSAHVFNVKIFERLLELGGGSWTAMFDHVKELKDEFQGNDEDDGAGHAAPSDDGAREQVGGDPTPGA